MNSVWDDMPHLVDADAPSRPMPNIPPPPGATILSNNGQAPRTAPASMPQSHPGPAQFPGYGPSMYNYPHYPNANAGGAFQFPTSQQYPYATWYQQYGGMGYPTQSMPSPYIPRQPPIPQMQSHDDQFAPLHRTHSQSASSTHRKRSNSMHGRAPSPWPSQSQGELSPLFDNPTTRPSMPSFTSYTTNVHTPSSTLSRSTHASSSSMPTVPPPGFEFERPRDWRRDFKFRSGFSSFFRSKSTNARPANDMSDSSRLSLHPALRHDHAYPPTIYDLRRDPLTLVFRALDHPPDMRDMAQPATDPPTRLMRVYHTRLPWFIDIVTDGVTPYVTLGDFFQQLFVALYKQIHRTDYFNGDLDNGDRDALSRAWLERCRDEREKMEGVRRVDFLRGKVWFEGLVRGKSGTWRLRTGRDSM